MEEPSSMVYVVALHSVIQKLAFHVLCTHVCTEFTDIALSVVWPKYVQCMLMISGFFSAYNDKCACIGMH